MSEASFFSNQRVLITGASGFIGSHLCRRLLGAAAEVHAVSRVHRNSPNDGMRWWQADLHCMEQVRNLFAAIKPAFVFHLSSCVTGSRGVDLVLPTFHSNLVSTVNLLTAATEIGCQRLILTGSLEEPDENGATPASPYAVAKWAGSAYARMFHHLYYTPVAIARVFMTYGPGQHDLQKLIPYVTLAMLQDQPPRLSSGQRPIDWIYVDDVVAGFLAIAQAPSADGQTFEIGSGVLVTIREIVQRIAALSGARVAPQFGALPDRPMERVRVADIASAYAGLGWYPRIELDEGLRRAVEWYAQTLAKPKGAI